MVKVNLLADHSGKIISLHVNTTRDSHSGCQISCCGNVYPSLSYRANWVKFNWHNIQDPLCPSIGSDEYPVYGKLLSIYVVNHKPLFHVQMLETVEFCTNFHCYYRRVAFTRGLSGCKRLSFISSFTYTHLLWYVIYYVQLYLNIEQ